MKVALKEQHNFQNFKISDLVNNIIVSTQIFFGTSQILNWASYDISSSLDFMHVSQL